MWPGPTGLYQSHKQKQVEHKYILLTLKMIRYEWKNTIFEKHMSANRWHPRAKRQHRLCRETAGRTCRPGKGTGRSRSPPADPLSTGSGTSAGNAHIYLKQNNSVYTLCMTGYWTSIFFIFWSTSWNASKSLTVKTSQVNKACTEMSGHNLVYCVWKKQCYQWSYIYVFYAYEHTHLIFSTALWTWMYLPSTLNFRSAVSGLSNSFLRASATVKKSSCSRIKQNKLST